MTGPITWEQIAFIFGMLGTLAGVAGFLWLRVESARKATRAELGQERQMTQAQIDNLRNELTGFRIRVAENYATYETLKAVDERVAQALEGVEARIGVRLDDVIKMFQASRR
jgi:uncharacterized membrane-anchored protein YhcB (DUF1043 family)